MKIPGRLFEQQLQSSFISVTKLYLENILMIIYICIDKYQYSYAKRIKKNRKDCQSFS